MQPCECQASVWGATTGSLLKRYSQLGPLERLTFDRLDEHGRAGHADAMSFRVAVEASKRFAQDPQGWLVLLGPSGCGKTHLAAALANRIIAAGKPVLYVSAPDLFDHLRSGFDPDSGVNQDAVLTQIVQAPVLILDDLSVAGISAWALDKLERILVRRYDGRQPTVVASSSAESSFDERLHTRLFDPVLSVVCRIQPAKNVPAWYTGGVEPAMLEAMTFESFNVRGRHATQREQESIRAAFRACQTFAEHPDGWLLLAGDTGAGKTHLAVAIAGARLRRGEPVMFTFVPDLLDHLRRAYAPESGTTYDRLFEEVKSTELLILDDVGAESATPWAEEKLYQLVVHRHNARLPTVITTRLLLDDSNPQDEPRGRGRHSPRAALNPAIASRLRSSLVTLLPVFAPDYRDQEAETRRRRESRNR